MMSEGSHAPVWLFSFVDLAFLLLIAMTQLGGDGRPGAPELGQVVVPRITADTATPLPNDASDRWQLRVLPPLPLAGDGEDAPPFELTRAAAVAREAGAERIDLETLGGRLATLEAEGARMPLLAPHEDSRSKNLLEAVEVLERFWPRRRRATVEPVLAAR